MTFAVRRVVTGGDTIRSDGPAPGYAGQTDSGYAAILWLDGPARSVDDGGDEPPGPWRLEPPVGGLSSRVIRLAPPRAGARGDERWLRVRGDDDARPGMHTTDTLDLMVVLEGHVALGLDDGEYEFGPGDVAIQRGTAHRWRVLGDQPCTYAVTMIRPDPADPTEHLSLGVRTPADDGLPFRRLVTATGPDGSSGALSDGPPPVVLQRQSVLADMWQTGGPLRAPAQGGDVPGGWELNPAGCGIAFRMSALAAPEPSSPKGWHTTPTIDIDFILRGEIEMEVRNAPPVRLGPGDVVVQRGTDHCWTPLGDTPVQMAAVMISVA